ncbi:MAG: V-type ATPase subunit [Oscillospiraceae bacterium]|jgi:V/A-type H+-transporting ATPase subunit C|nr:V-type ATPase subunit [Oscillospiraceae bacterium]
MPIKDTDFLTATMVIRALERKLFDKERTARLCEARSDDEALRLLAECGYEAMPSLTAEGFEKALGASRRELYELLSANLPGEYAVILDVFRLLTDYHNIKSLIKGGESLLLDLGRVPVKELLVQYHEFAFTRLPGVMGEAARDARETLSRTGDPQASDFRLDRACLGEMRALAEASESAFLCGYVRLYTDVYNLRSLVRAQRIGKGPDYLRLILSPGGNVGLARLAAALQSGGAIEDLFSGGALAEAAEVGGPASRGEGSLTEFEKLCDDALLFYARSARAVAFGEQPLIGYLLEREAEMTMLRTVIGGRLGGVPVNQVKERLRAAYG